MREWFLDNLVWLAALGAAAVILWKVVQYARHRQRRARPVRLHPNLQKYAAPGQLASERRKEASKIAATSSTGEIAGYEIVEQVEAVFVDGFVRPEEALEGLKAAAAMKGANAVINVRQERSSPGRYGAAGDAVKAVSLTAPPRPSGPDRPRRRDSPPGENTEAGEPPEG